MTARLITAHVDNGNREVVFESDSLHFEAPNWSPDGQWLVINAEGRMFRLPAEGASTEADLVEIDLGEVPGINNDHLISPDGSSFYVSGHDGHLYEVPWAGGSSRRVTPDRDPAQRFKHYLHGISPDGRTLSYIGGGLDDTGEWVTNVYTIGVDGSDDRRLTNDAFPDDGAEIGPDGVTLWFNSERGSGTPGHAQVFTMALDGSAITQLTFDERVNWFPHPSPDGERVVYISFPPGTLGHPADKDVILRALDPASHETRDLHSFNGGQGTINVTSWAPDSRRFAYVTY